MPNVVAGAAKYRRSISGLTASLTIRLRGFEAVSRNDPYSGFRFVVEINGLLQAACSKVKGLQRETRVDSYREGGVNDFERKFINITAYPNLVLDRGLADPWLWNWHQGVVEGLVVRNMLTITLRDELGKSAWAWIVTGAFPVKWAATDFDANSGQIVTESIEFAHHGFLRRPLPRDNNR
jgi:phage tail-like protein